MSVIGALWMFTYCILFSHVYSLPKCLSYSIWWPADYIISLLIYVRDVTTIFYDKSHRYCMLNVSIIIVVSISHMYKLSHWFSRNTSHNRELLVGMSLYTTLRYEDHMLENCINTIKHIYNASLIYCEKCSVSEIFSQMFKLKMLKTSIPIFYNSTL